MENVKEEEVVVVTLLTGPRAIERDAARSRKPTCFCARFHDPAQLARSTSGTPGP